MEMTCGQVEQLARLARLSLTPGEQEAVVGQLEQMVEYLQVLAQVETEEGGETGQSCVLRPDGAEPSLARDKLLSGSLLAMIQRVVRDAAQSEEVAQEVLVVLEYLRIKTFE